MKVNAITLRSGNVIEHEGRLFAVVKNDVVQPGKGNSVAQVELRDVRTGTKTNVRYRTQESVERRDIIGDPAAYLTEGMTVEVETYEGEPLAVTLPKHVTVKIVEAEPVIKGQTATTSYKPAIIENGEKIMVPPHVESGTRIVVKSEDGTYVERAKD